MNAFLIALAALLCAYLVDAECGRKPAGTRVINGVNAERHAWPWQVSLRRGGHTCGGSLISATWVVTAAHCIHRNQNPSGYTVALGAHDRSKPTSVQQIVRVSRIIEHPKYDSRRLNNDIALLKLASPVRLSDKVGTVCLTKTKPSPGKGCYITGWGATRGGGRLPNILQQAKLPIASDAQCKRKYGSVNSVAHLCAGEARHGASGGCNGDSGGPLVCEEGGRWYLHGAVSFGLRNCPTTHYTVFARVASYIDWIKQHSGVGPGGGGPPPPPTGNPPPPPPPPTNNPPPPPPPPTNNPPPPPPPPTNNPPPPPPPPPTNNPPPPPPPPPPTQPPTGCKDKLSRCPRYQRWCKTSARLRAMCPKTCNSCGGGGGGGGGGNCKDISRRCQRNKHQCRSNPFVQKRCKKTCNLC